MNKILNINLGGYALTIDDDAYEYISSYLESIRRRFSESEGRDEIMRDIESRLGEIISNGLGNRTIVMLPDVEGAIEVMGKPEDFGGEPVEKPGAGGSAKKTVTTGKKMYRDEDDAVIGGVCSGLSAYFGLAEPLWMRLGFIVLTLVSFGFWVPAYVLLWILIPPARTAAERLSMRGEKANVENIAREIEQGVERLSRRVNEFGAQSTVSSAGRNTARVAAGCLNVFVRLAFGFIIFIASALVLALATVWVLGMWALFTAQPYVAYFSPFSSGTTYLGFFNLFFLLGIPVIGLILLVGRRIFHFRTPDWLSAAMGVFWAINLVSLLILGGSAFRGYSQNGSISDEIKLNELRSDTLRVELSGNDQSGGFGITPNEHNGISIGNKRMKLNDMVRINIRRSPNGQFGCRQVIEARGSSTEDAVENARMINFEVTQVGNTLYIPNGYDLKSGAKWRVQEVWLTIFVPEGKYIVFGDVINHRIYDADYADPDGDYYIGRYPDNTFRMTGNGLVCNDCPQFGDRQYRDGRYYEKFILEGNFNTEIIHDDNFSISFDDPQNEQKAVQYIRIGDEITLTTRGKSMSGQLRCTIRTPVFTSLFADNSGPVTIRGFREGRSSITTKGPVHVRGFFDSGELNLALSGSGSVELVGSGNALTASLTDGAALEAAAWRAEEVNISASNSSRARVNAGRDAEIKADAGSTINVEGTAHVHGPEQQ